MAFWGVGFFGFFSSGGKYKCKGGCHLVIFQKDILDSPSTILFHLAKDKRH